MKNLRSIALIALGLLLSILWIAPNTEKVNAGGTIPSDHPLLVAARNAATPQDSVAVVTGAYDSTPSDEKKNFAGGVQFEAKEGEVWLVATDWMGVAPNGVTPIKTEGGYGTWLINGPWTGFVPKGIGIMLVAGENPGTAMQIFLPFVSYQVPLPEIAIVQQADDQESAQASVAFVVAKYNDPELPNAKENFDGGKQISIADGQIWLIATDWGTNRPVDANPVVVENHYGTWVLTGPWEGEIPSGVGIQVQ